MKNQRMKQTQGARFAAVAVTCMMVALLIACFAIPTFAANGDVQVDIGKNLDFSGSSLTLDSGVYAKEYDGTAAVTGIVATAEALTGVAEGDEVALKVEKAEFNSATVADASELRVYLSLTGKDAAKYTVAEYISVSAKILPKQLSFSGNATAQATYQPTNPTYASLAVEDLPLLVDANGATVAGVQYTVGTLNLQATAAGDYTVNLAVTLSDPNYTAAPLPVVVTVKPLALTSVQWKAQDSYEYGDAAANALAAFGYDAEGNEYALAVIYPTNYGHATTYTVTAQVSDPSLILETDGATKTVVITKKTYTVSFEDASYLATAPGSANVQTYALSVKGKVPTDVLAKVTYTVNGAPFTGTATVGTYTVTATLPKSINYSFVDAEGNAVTAMTATLSVNHGYLAAGTDGSTHEVIVTAQGGVPVTGSVTVTVPTDLARKAINGLRRYDAYTVQVSDIDGAYSITFPIADFLYAKGFKNLDASCIYLYDAATGTRVRLTEATGYTVTVEGGRVQIDGVAGSEARTFIIAPIYATPFFLSAPGIALILLVVLAILAWMYLTGKKLREDLRKRNPVIVIETEGNVPEVTPEEQPELVDVEEALDETMDEIAEVVEEELAQKTEENTEDVSELVAETMQELIEEAEAEAAAEEVAAEEEAVEAEEVVEDTAEAAIAQEAPEAVQTLANAEEESEDEDESDGEGDSDEEDGFDGFGPMPDSFTDAMEDPEAYAALLAKESAGEVRLVTRYKRSFQSRLAQSQGNVQEYYSAIKNALLANKGVKARTSWNYEAFNKGRAHVAKINAKSKTLYLYLALDPSELEGTKYGFVDVSSKKKYASVPVLMKIKGDRKFKHALELIEKLCREKMELPALELQNNDYTIPFQTTEELVQAGLVKKMVGAVPAFLYGQTEAPTQESTASAAVEQAEVSFVAPDNAPAVDAAAEE